MKKEVVTITIEPEVKEKIKKILESRDQKLSTVINSYLRDLIEEVKNAKPNAS